MSSPTPFSPPTAAGPFTVRARPERPVPAPARPRFRPRRAPWLPLGLSAALVLTGLAWFAPAPPPDARPAEGGPAPSISAAMLSPPVWQPLPQALPLYTFDAPDGWDLPQSQEARQHAGGGREDRIEAGGVGQPQHLRLNILRGVPDPAPSRFYVDLVRRAAEAGLAVERSGAPLPLATKFGTVEAAPVTFQGGRTCLAFRFAHAELSFRLQGWVCAGDRAAEADRLACALDRLELVNGSEDPRLRAFFAKAEAWRTGVCGTLRPARG